MPKKTKKPRKSQPPDQLVVEETTRVEKRQPIPIPTEPVTLARVLGEEIVAERLEAPKIKRKQIRKRRKIA